MVDAIATDTRALPGGNALFIALKGERFDGHAHVQAAIDGGCVAALAARELDIDTPHVVVADTELALGAFAAAVQRERSTKVLAITGSNGKTSVKTLLLSILQQLGGAYANPGNRNNEIGLPLAVLDAPDDARFAVYEMGAGKPGDIAYLTEIARPDVALVNNIAPAHLERMGSMQGVAETKGAIYGALPADGVAVVNADDSFASTFIERAQGRGVLRFGIDAAADVQARDIRIDADGSRFVLVSPHGDAEVRLPMPGRHNVRNALAAAAMAFAVGASLEQVRAGLEAVQPVAGRLVAHALRNGAVLVDDSYNANPGSLAAALDTLASSGNEAWVVLGDMRELGAEEIALHAQAGQQAKAAGIARLFALGELSAHAAQAFGDGALEFETHAALVDALLAGLRPGVRVLVKGSRGSAMDRIVMALLQRDAAENGGGTTDAA
ncbi:UDP-N-acetylmuramoyl-tripeptide--D-alanyl-D-alanine ligase [Thermomonas carbonis]|uniref:UDP-N-acetylmuramoyl-tripeptide--D-alanyl-D-alanine ligase n=2 Tax=Thermomonas carbonis TaxID=1463158 RepID=A0A7G9SUS1_9GAMM|nr:UDP-N-acetylmuramoyl-tripeptide--D-alanyl-D-alanine ligase [Thermomonas carbonis]